MTDIKHTEDGDIDLRAGDIMMVEPTEQHQCDILLSARGDFKEFPAVGVDSATFINDSESDEFMRSVRLQMTRDGMTVHDITIDNEGNLTIDAHYENN